MWGFQFLLVLLLAVMVVVTGCQAVRLPNATPENQMISITTVIDVVGMVDDHTIMNWDLSNQYQGQGILKTGEVIGSLMYSDLVMTNGGHLMMNKHFDFDSSNQERGNDNLESTKVITYESVEGSHLFADEILTMSNAGNYTASDGVISCVFGGSSSMIPAFCNTVTVRSTLINVNSAQISTSVKSRMASASGRTPAGLSYHIDLTPNPVSGLGSAVGSARTEFTITSLEAGGNSPDIWNRTSAENSVSDKSHVTGGIIHFSKAFDYGSGIQP